MGSPVRRFASFDPGSRRLGCVIGETGADRWTREAPGTLEILDALPVDVDPEDLAAAAATAIGWALRFEVCGFVIERGPLYMPAKVTPQAARQIAVNHAVMSRLADLLAALGLAQGLKIRTVARQSWAHAVIPRTKGGITDAMVLAALPRHLDPASFARLTTKDLRDAAGALLWSLLPPTLRAVRPTDPDAPKRPRIKYPPEEMTWAHCVWRSRAARLRSYRLCQAAATANPAATLARLSAVCPCGPHPPGRRPLTCPHAPPSVVAPLGVCPGVRGRPCATPLTRGSTWCAPCAVKARVDAADLRRTRRARVF